MIHHHSSLVISAKVLWISSLINFICLEDCLEKKRLQDDLIVVFQYLKGAKRKTERDCLQGSNRTRGNGFKMKEGFSNGNRKRPTGQEYMETNVQKSGDDLFRANDEIKNCFTERLAISPGIFKKRLDKALSGYGLIDVVVLDPSLDTMTLEDFSSLNDSVIPSI
ncbi:hypothetical protein DUI87_11055 [Hirundo rustica rustica]|uniref:Uncharacterized protein n=1 Tax=Hirundo rustica rustica TaxID=333673 RepID=A0A3M0KFE5_HIRRU|nr:hypothetical protein DUI87_11055 [Hirundo rustica rustica]